MFCLWFISIFIQCAWNTENWQRWQQIKISFPRTVNETSSRQKEFSQSTTIPLQSGKVCSSSLQVVRFGSITQHNEWPANGIDFQLMQQPCSIVLMSHDILIRITPCSYSTKYIDGLDSKCQSAQAESVNKQSVIQPLIIPDMECSRLSDNDYGLWEIEFSNR